VRAWVHACGIVVGCSVNKRTGRGLTALRAALKKGFIISLLFFIL